MNNENNSERQSEPTASQQSSNPQQDAPEPLGSTACCASSFCEEIAPILDSMFHRKGVGRVEFRAPGTLEFKFGHCSIGLTTLGKYPDFTPFTTCEGLLIKEHPPVALEDLLNRTRVGLPT